MKNTRSLFNIVLFIIFLTTSSIFVKGQNIIPEGLMKRSGISYEIKSVYHGIGNQNKSSISIGTKTEHGGEYSVAIGDNSSSEGYAAITQGYEAKSDGYSSISLGYKAYAGANYAIAQGYNAKAEGGTSISIGSDSNSKRAFSVSIGNESKATSEHSVAIGSNSVTNNKVSVNTVTLGELTLKDFAGSNPHSVVSIGATGKERQLQYVSAGQISSKSTDAINGSQLYASNMIMSNIADSIKLILGGNASIKDNKITIDNIGGVGKNSIHEAMVEFLKKNEEINNELKSSKDELKKLSDNTMIISGDKGNTDTQTLSKDGGLKFSIKGSEYIKTEAKGSEVLLDFTDKVKSDISKGVAANSGVASAVAMANLPQISRIDDRKHNVAGAYGYYNGEHAFALGMSGLNEVGNVIYKVSGAFNTKGNLSLGAGLGYQFGINGKEKTNEIIVERENIINRDELDKLNDLNNKLNQRIDELERRLKAFEDIKINEDELYTLTGYKTGKFELTNSQEEILKDIVRELNENYRNRKIYITGYTDTMSNEDLNLELGLKRANVVAKKLRALGLDMSISIRKVSSSGYNNIIETNKSSSGRSSNRRVEIELR
ncbi:OmpA family protein [Streptobacillus moniliformis]|uniref:OmpA family protein n=1 Tax=Streptobacillus moniliformis TaxID=34105 RepID=UPI0007E3C5B9|nr:OmpA family protein [Streptobacillus moniliformis]